MSGPRGEFSSRFGFLMAASGSAVGLGNIWGFPTNVASNGGAAFLFMYLLLAFTLAYPALMAELIIGRHTRSNAVGALQQLAVGPKSRRLGSIAGFAGIATVSLILSFYAIVSGWMLAWLLNPLSRSLGLDTVTDWLSRDGIPRNAIFSLIFMMLTVLVIRAGVHNGIEKWATRLMPALVLILILLIFYVLTLDGAIAGLRAYLIPDFSRIFSPTLIVSALGQAFFSLSLGVGTMLIYGSYLNSKESLPTTGGLVTILDTGIAFLAGLLILPAMYVALANGIEIYDTSGAFVAGPGLIVMVLPALFDTMGSMGVVVALAFFLLMSIASLTSSISMLEVPVAYVVETFGIARDRATLILGALVSLMSLLIVFNFDLLFDLVVTVTTEFSQPLLGLFFTIFIGWVWHRDGVLKELQSGCNDVEQSFFWKVWPFYVRWICPAAITAVYIQLLFF
jgi:NSS family neurotransmitter:Na+ symporter